MQTSRISHVPVFILIIILKVKVMKIKFND